MSKVLVTGGTGRLGRLLVPELGAREHDVRVLSRTAGAGRVVADLADGTGLDAALRGAQVVVHAATSGRIKAVDIDGAHLRNDAGAGRNDGYRDHPVVLVEDLGHAELLAQQAFHLLTHD